MYNKKGLSTVVTTLIIILLVLVAIGIIWVVVRNVITGSGEQIDINTKCVTTNLEINTARCTAATGACTLSVNKVGGYTLDGVKIIYSSSTASGTAIDQPGDIVVSMTYSPASGLTTPLTVPTNVRLAGYFNDATGVAISCPQVSEMNVTLV
ncbi:hypothetical protein HYT23_07050 [Candidatus Pacearchaeota archaeon]|nr:hypothetical protein [Candidatus Pacearchaeota archaeon]